MKLQKSKPLKKSRETSIQGNGYASSISVTLMSVACITIWLSVGGLGRVIVAASVSFLLGPICLVAGRLTSRSSEVRKPDLFFSFGATITTTGILNYLSLAMPGTFSNWFGFDAISLFFVFVLSSVACLTWFTAKNMIYRE